MKYKRNKKVLLLLSLSFLIFGCSKKAEPDNNKEEVDINKIFNEFEAKFNDSFNSGKFNIKGKTGFVDSLDEFELGIDHENHKYFFTYGEDVEKYIDNENENLGYVYNKNFDGESIQKVVRGYGEYFVNIPILNDECFNVFKFYFDENLLQKLNREIYLEGQEYDEYIAYSAPNFYKDYKSENGNEKFNLSLNYKLMCDVDSEYEFIETNYKTEISYNDNNFNITYKREKNFESKNKEESYKSEYSFVLNLEKNYFDEEKYNSIEVSESDLEDCVSSIGNKVSIYDEYGYFAGDIYFEPGEEVTKELFDEKLENSCRLCPSMFNIENYYFDEELTKIVEFGRVFDEFEPSIYVKGSAAEWFFATDEKYVTEYYEEYYDPFLDKELYEKTIVEEERLFNLYENFDSTDANGFYYGNYYDTVLIDGQEISEDEINTKDKNRIEIEYRRKTNEQNQGESQEYAINLEYSNKSFNKKEYLITDISSKDSLDKWFKVDTNSLDFNVEAVNVYQTEERIINNENINISEAYLRDDITYEFFYVNDGGYTKKINNVSELPTNFKGKFFIHTIPEYYMQKFEYLVIS